MTTFALLEKPHRLIIRDLSKLEVEVESSSSDSDQGENGESKITNANALSISTRKRQAQSRLEKAWDEVCASKNEIDKRLVKLKHLVSIQKKKIGSLPSSHAKFAVKQAVDRHKGFTPR